MSKTGGYIFDAKTAKPLGYVDDEGTTVECKLDTLNVVTGSGKPEVATVREVRIDYSENLGDANKSLSVETFATFGELRKLMRDLMEVTR